MDREQTTEEGTKEKKEIPSQEVWPFDLNLTKEGKINAKIYSGYMGFYESTGINVLTDSVRADFYNKDGNHTSYLTSDSAFVNDRMGITTAKGNVTVVSDSGMTLFTEILHYSRISLKIYTDDFVTIIRANNDTLYGEGFESDSDFTNMDIKKTHGSAYRKNK
ncbi:MAG: LPS export ABC transporter periplasmic protein LptC [bacterium]|nr:LPS export ABC transporter periplasmic protein LptC [bacterium]